MFKKMVGSLLGRIPALSVGEEVDGAYIAAYVLGLKERDDDRLDDEIRNRGLAYGNLCIKGTFGKGVEFETRYSLENTPSIDDVRREIRTMLKNPGYRGLTLVERSGSDSVIVAVTDEESGFEAYANMGNDHNGEWVNDKVFLDAQRFSDFPLKLTGSGDQGVEFILQLAGRLGLKTSPAHFANESEVPISKIVEHAYVWTDRRSGKRFVEVKYDKSLVVSCVYIGAGSWEDYEEDGKTVIVLASEHSANKVKLNNVFVRPRRTLEPTPFMERMRAKRKKAAAKTCRVCGQAATREVVVTLTEVLESDTFCDSSHGSSAVIYACDSREHADEIIANTPEGLRHSVNTYEPEAW
jgi:hypothetical protein